MAVDAQLINRLRTARQQQSSSPVDMLKDVGAFGLGAVAAVGNFLDTPGSTVRDLLAGKGLKSSFDQWLTPFSSENRTTGRELLTKFFGVSRNKETGISGWLRDPAEGLADLGGFAVEVILDPFGPVAKPLGIPGKLAAAAGKAGRVGRAGIAALPMGNEALRAFDVASESVVAATRQKFVSLVANAKTYARQQAIARAMPALKRFEDDTIGHTVDALNFIQEHGQGVDDPGFVGQVTRYLEGTEDARRNMLLHNDSFDVFDAQGRPVMQGLTVADITTTTDGRQIYEATSGPTRITIDPTVQDLKLVKTATDPDFKFLDPKFYPTLERFKAGGELDIRLRALMQEAAHRTPQLEDVTGVQYVHRQMSDYLKKVILDEEGRIRTNLGQNGWNADPEMYRQFIFKDIWGGTPAVNEVFKDATWGDVVDSIKADNDKFLPVDSYGPIRMSKEYVTSNHLDIFAQKIGMTADELWEEIGFDLTRPYAPIADVQNALSRYKDTLNTNAARGVGAVKPKGTFGRTVFEDLSNGAAQSLRVDDSGMFHFTPNGKNVGGLMQHNITDPKEFDDLVNWIESKGVKRADAVAKATDMVKSGRAVFSWEVDIGKWTPERQYFTPQLESTFTKGFNVNMKNLAKNVEDNAVLESEVIAKALSNEVRKKYGHIVTKDMPYVDPNGMFEFVDSLGRTRSIPISEYTKMKADADAAAALGFAIPPNANIYSEVLFGTAKQKMASRYDAIGDLLQKRANMRDFEIFGGNPLVNTVEMMKARARAAFVDMQFREFARETVINHAREFGTYDAAGNLLPDMIRTQSSIRSTAYAAKESEKLGPTLGELLDSRRAVIDKSKFLNKLRSEVEAEGLSFGKLSDQDVFRHLTETKLDPKQMEDIMGLWKFFEKPPEADVLKLVDNFSTIMKGNLLATPSTVVRNLLSGAVNAVLTGDIQLFKGGFASLRDGFKLASGKVIQDIPLTPDLEAFMKIAGRNPADAADRSAAFVARFIGAMNKTRAHAQLESADMASLLKSGSGENIVEALPKDASVSNAIHGLGEFWKSQSVWQHLNPFNVPGVLKWENDKWVARSTSNLPVYLSSQINSIGDNAVRMSAVLDRMKRGDSFEDAFAAVQWHQVSYDSRNYTRFESGVMKRLFPFYSFLSRSLAMTAVELATKPGGGLGMLLRGQRIGMGSGNEFVPTDVQDTAAIPLAPGKEGELRYLTNLGLMHEDAVRYLAPTQGIRGIGQQVLGSMHPALKTFIEYSMNTSTFFEGPMGGRRLDDLDPKLGRIVYNIRKQASDIGIGPAPQLEASGRPAPIGGSLGEALVANSPLSSYLRYVHVATDPRRSLADRAVNLLTGVRTREYSNEAMTREIRDRLNAIEVSMGARPLTTVIGSKDIIARLRETGQDEEAARLEAIQQLLSSYRKKSALADKAAK